jgi:hypothetical protein
MSALVRVVLALVPPEYIAQLLTAIGTGLAALIGLVGLAIIKIGKQRDEANRESTLEEARRGRDAQAQRIEELTNQVAELNRIILIEGGFFKRPNDSR